MKIAFLLHGYEPAGKGLERDAISIAEWLAKFKNCTVYIFTSQLACNNNNKLNLPFRFIYVPEIPLFSFLKILSFAFFSTILLKNARKELDIVYSFTPDYFSSPDIYFAGGGSHLEWLKTRKAYKIDSPLKRCSIPINPLHIARLKLEKRLLKKKQPKKIVVLSQRSKQEFIQNYSFPADRVVVIPNGIDLQSFNPQIIRPKYRQLIRTKYNVNERQLLILFVGSGFRRKGLIPLINALELVDFDFKLLVVGDDPNSSFYKKVAEAMLGNKVIFAGVETNINEVYSAADIFVLPTIYEPFGNAILEAMASGLPVIVSKTAGCAELITHGVNGILLENPSDKYEIKDSLQKLTDRITREKIGEKARETASLYPREKMFEMHFNLLKTIAD